ERVMGPGKANDFRDDKRLGPMATRATSSITRALAYPQRPGASLRRGRMYVWSIPRLGWWQTRLRDCLARLVASHTCVVGHATTRHTVSSLTRSLLDSQHQRSRSRLSVPCP